MLPRRYRLLARPARPPPKSSYSQKCGMYNRRSSPLQLDDFLLKYDRWALQLVYHSQLHYGRKHINRSFADGPKTAEQLKPAGRLPTRSTVFKTDSYSYRHERQTIIYTDWFRSRSDMSTSTSRAATTGRRLPATTVPPIRHPVSFQRAAERTDRLRYGTQRRQPTSETARQLRAEVGGFIYQSLTHRTSNLFFGFRERLRMIPAADLNLKRPKIVVRGRSEPTSCSRALNFDIAYYDGESKNQIVSMPVSQASGVASRYALTRAASRNWGWGKYRPPERSSRTKKCSGKPTSTGAQPQPVLELGEASIRGSWLLLGVTRPHMTAYEDSRFRRCAAWVTTQHAQSSRSSWARNGSLTMSADRW